MAKEFFEKPEFYNNLIASQSHVRVVDDVFLAFLINLFSEAAYDKYRSGLVSSASECDSNRNQFPLPRLLFSYTNKGVLAHRQDVSFESGLLVDVS